MTEQERSERAAENYRRMRSELDRRLSLDPELRRISKKIKDGTADFNDTFRYSEIVSKHIGKIMQENIGEITNPLGKQYVCEALLNDHYDAINDVLGTVQVSLDEELGIHLKPVKAPKPAERIRQVAHSLEDPGVKPEVIRRRAGAPVVNTAMSMHDDYIRINAQKRNDLGLKPVITRYGSGCCDWCSAVAGKWRFGEQPDDVFRRHDNCDCVIIYDTQVLRGVKTEGGGRSKTWHEVDPSDLQIDPPKVLSREEAESLQNAVMERLTLDRNRSIIKTITVDDIVSAGMIDKQQPSVIKDDVAKAIMDTISAAKNEGGKFSFDGVRAVSIPQNADGGMVVFQTNAIDRYGFPYVVLEVNVLAVGDLDVESVDALFSQADNTKCNSLADGIIHEIGHAKTIYGRTFANYERISEDLENVHIDGISTLAQKDGLELIAESEVLLSRGEKLQPEVMKIYNTYTTGGG